MPYRPPFIYHLRPRLHCPRMDATLIDLRIKPLGIHLTGGDLATGRPYPNKDYQVGRRKIGRKAVDGLLLKLSAWPPDIEMKAQWAIDAVYVATHRVIYKLLDKDFEAASEDMTLWHDDGGLIDGHHRFESRWPAAHKDSVPVQAEPCMEIYPTIKVMPADVCDDRGRLRERTEIFALPTIEAERLLGSAFPRERIPLPTLEMALTL